MHIGWSKPKRIEDGVVTFIAFKEDESCVAAAPKVAEDAEASLPS